MFELILQALPMHIAVLDQSGTILYVNAAWEEFARQNGAPSLAGTSVGANYLAVTDQAVSEREEGALQVRRGLGAVLDGKLPLFTLEYPCHSPTEQRWFCLYAMPLPGHDGQAVVAHLDITEHKLLEMRLSTANWQMSDFLSVFTHEARTPLTSSDGYVQLAYRRLRRLQEEVRQGGLNPEVLQQRLADLEHTIDQALAPARRLNRLLTDLADVAQSQSGRLNLHRARCDLVEIVKKSVEEQRVAWPGRKLLLQVSEQAVMISADPDRIGQVVTNYLTNALKYAPSELPIEISMSRDPRQVQVSVRDQGPGIPLEEQRRIWQRFYRSPHAEAQQGMGINLGMGLYICRTIIAQHGGQTGVDSMLGSGATFWFTLPVDGAARAGHEGH